MNGKRELFITWPVVILLVVLAALVQRQSDLSLRLVYQKQRVNQIPPIYYPTAAALKKTDLGFHRATADAIWLSTIQYFGGGNPNQPYLSLKDMLNTVVDVDPTFAYPYEFGGIILPWQGEPQAAIGLLNKGIEQYPDNGLLYYYAGSTAKIQLNNSALAAQYFQQSIGKQGTPPAAAILAGVSLTSLDNREFAKQWWEGILNDPSQKDVIKERAKVWLEHLNLVISLEELIKQVNAQGGTPVKSLGDLVNRGVLKTVPVSPLGPTLIYDPKTGRVDLSTN